MYYLIDLIKGRFIIIEDFDYYIVITPWYASDEKLFSMIVLEKQPELGLKIIVGIKEDENLGQWANITIQDISRGSIVIEKLSNLNCEKLLIDSGYGFAPGEIKGLKSMGQEVVQNTFLNVLQNESVEAKEENLNSNDYMERDDEHPPRAGNRAGKAATGRLPSHPAALSC